MKRSTLTSGVLSVGAFLALALLSPPLHAAEATADAVNAYAIDNFFLFICAVLVLFMQAGFALVESGLNAAKNTVNILFKNMMDLGIGVILFYVIGYGLMYPGDAFSGGWFGFGGFGISADSPGAAAGNLHPAVDFLFQVAFAATAATIVSGAVAGRMKFEAYLIYSVIITAFVYPISGFWKWGGGFLNEMGFYDFAGSLVVHALGGFAGLAAAIVLGPRIGRFNADGSPNALPGHNLALSTLGVFILLIGWFGFNPGSQLAIAGAANTDIVMIIATNTLLSAAAGSVAAMLFAWVIFKKPDLTMAMNGLLGGLVGITANCDSVTYNESLIIGIVAGILVVLGVKMLDALKIDDPVGAWPVHGLNGVWGGLATWIFGGHPMVAQIVGSIVIPLWGFATMLVLFLILKSVGMLRVSRDDEMKGLDISEHEEEAYYGFDIFTTR
ncbi:ammonium transporter [Chlorobium sp. N1]|uniref:ammonium transporter n=1 Tax=Chlorobium sp. N1 TaxID=2491138 RepID=UPI00103D78C3|nr:ammonium transporter [Chlorobium sp. N1]TCD47488.1 ammonium transporter [Chlorobium sp. N1]